MDLSSLEAAAALSKHAVVLLGAGGVFAGYRAWYFAVKKEDDKRLHAQFAVVLLAALAACAGYSVYYFTNEISLERERLLERFKLEKTAEIQSASARAAEADARAAEAVRSLRGLEIELVRQRERAARAEKELVEIQERLKPRRITDAQRGLLIQALQKSPKGPLTIATPIGDAEAQMFARQIREILESSGWKGVRFTQNLFKGTPVGLSVNVRDGNKVPLFAEMLRQAFESSGTPIYEAYNPELTDETVQLLVGMKP